MPALLKTTQIQEPSSASVNIQLDSSGNVALVPTAGNVGIGTTSPSHPLTVNTSSGGVGLAINGRSSDNLASAFLFANNGSTQYGTITASASEFRHSSIPAAAVQTFYTNASERMRITANGGVSFGSSGTAYGTSGQVLQSNGDAAPSWTTISATGALIRAPQILTSGTSYTTPSNCTKIYVEAWGGGGNGGSATGSPTYDACAGGGGAGAYCAKYFTVTGSTAYTYAIGAGGGGNTTFTVGATTITAGGGSVGGSAAASVSGAGGAGGTATNGDLNGRGGQGTAGYVIYGGASTKYGELGGSGGSTSIGGGGIGPVFSGGGVTLSGGNAVGYGSGGGGGISASSTGNGGAGAAGLIRIWEFT